MRATVSSRPTVDGTLISNHLDARHGAELSSIGGNEGDG